MLNICKDSRFVIFANELKVRDCQNLEIMLFSPNPVSIFIVSQLLFCIADARGQLEYHVHPVDVPVRGTAQLARSDRHEPLDQQLERCDRCDTPAKEPQRR